MPRSSEGFKGRVKDGQIWSKYMKIVTDDVQSRRCRGCAGQRLCIAAQSVCREGQRVSKVGQKRCRVGQRVCVWGKAENMHGKECAKWS